MATMKRTPVTVQSGAFLFCRIGITLLLWLAWVLQSIPLLGLVFIILALSALLGVDRAPMIVLYTWTLGRLHAGKSETLDRGAMRFAHALGSLWSGCCLLLILVGLVRIGWGVTFLLAIVKTISALGFCPASKLYLCATGGCCPLSRKLFGDSARHG
jgi:hypothetical protein